MDKNFEIIAKTLFGMESLLANELTTLGAQKVRIGNRMVSFYGDKGFIYKSNLSLRTAIRILKPILKFNASNEFELYDAISSIDWTNIIPLNKSFRVDSVIYGKIFNNSLYVSQKVKDSIVDKIKFDTGTRPSVKIEDPDFRINIHIDNKKCTLSIDSSGISLHQRGYRLATEIAPINEVLAAGILLHSSWDGDSDFLDPFCGSGTIPIEAAMIAFNIPANINRKKFSFENWNDWDEQLFYTIEESLLKKIKPKPIKIMGSDILNSAIEKSLINIESANLSEFINIKKENFLNSSKIIDKPLKIVTNPPYGERIDSDVFNLYSDIGTTLKHKYINTDVWIISSNLKAIKNIGLKTSKKIKLMNGKLDSQLNNYSIYKGSKKK